MQEAPDATVRALGDREDRPGDVEIVDGHREPALGLVPAPLRGDVLEHGTQLVAGLLDGHDQQAVPSFRHPRDRLPYLADRAAREGELRRPEHRLLTDRDRPQAEPAV